MQNAVTWFEIPASNLQRATEFYGIDSEGNRVGLHAA
jgi:hypothetical protein